MTEVDDRVVLGVGRVVLDTAKLEWMLSYLVTVAEQRPDGWVDETVSMPGGAMREFSRFAGAYLGPLSAGLKRLERLARDALNARHTLAHSVTVVEEYPSVEALRAQLWHPRSQTMGLPTVEALAAQSRTVQSLSGAALRLAVGLRAEAGA